MTISKFANELDPMDRYGKSVRRLHKQYKREDAEERQAMYNRLEDRFKGMPKWMRDDLMLQELTA